jgi:hypothetical protein
LYLFQAADRSLVKSNLFCCGGFCKKSAAALVDRRDEKGVSSLQEPSGISISARKSVFSSRRQDSLVQVC